MAEKDVYDKAVEVWVERKFDHTPGSVTHVEFAIEQTGYCETCASEEVGVEYKLNGKYVTQVIPSWKVTPGKMMSECAEIVKELNANS